MGSLKGKRVLKRCLWGTILDNSAFFGTISVPLGHQIGVVPPKKNALFSKTVPQWHHFLQNGALSKKKGTIFTIFTIFVPLWHCFFYRKCMGKQCPFGSGTKTVPQKVPFYGRPNGAPRAPFWCHLFFECSYSFPTMGIEVIPTVPDPKL